MLLLSPLLSNGLAPLDSVGVCTGQTGGQGQGRTADLPLFRRSVVSDATG